MTSINLTQPILVLSAGTPRAIGRFLRSSIKPLVITMLSVSAVFMILVTAVAYLPTLTGLKTMIVISGSMEPTIGTGSAILIEELPTSEIRIGDAISFEGTAGHLVTHRVIAIKEIKGEIYFQTLGDANLAPDPNLAPAGAVVGRVRAVLPHMGYVLYYSSGKWATIAMIGIPAILLMGLEIRSLFNSAKKKRPETKRIPSSGVSSIKLPLEMLEPTQEFLSSASTRIVSGSISAPEYWASSPVCVDGGESA